jgi:hypothetical protein
MAQPGGSSATGGTKSLNLEVCLALFVAWLLFFQPNKARSGLHARKRQRLSAPSSALPAFMAPKPVDVTLSANQELGFGSNDILQSDHYLEAAAEMQLGDALEQEFFELTEAAGVGKKKILKMMLILPSCLSTQQTRLVQYGKFLGIKGFGRILRAGAVANSSIR